MFKPHLILHPTDYSDCSAYAYDIALDLARQYTATLLVVHVAETLGPENLTYGEVGSQLEPEGYRQRLEEDLHRSVPAPAGVSVEYLLAAGDPAHEIGRVAREQHCDLIVMGTHARTGLSRLFTRSIAEQVIHLAPCPVLISKGAAPAG
jgi:nucleotide-binding universal stress UspA family protein